MAARALEAHDVVIGPAYDGGYYLIGLRRPRPDLFAGIDWSTERVLAQTVDRVHKAGLSAFYLPFWYDVDTANNLKRLQRDARPGTAVAAAFARAVP